MRTSFLVFSHFNHWIRIKSTLRPRLLHHVGAWCIGDPFPWFPMARRRKGIPFLPNASLKDVTFPQTLELQEFSHSFTRSLAQEQVQWSPQLKRSTVPGIACRHLLKNPTLVAISISLGWGMPQGSLEVYARLSSAIHSISRWLGWSGPQVCNPWSSLTCSTSHLMA